jgi:flagellar biogenesis protein FliO
MNDADNLAMLGRVVGGLIVVLVLIGLAARVARRARGQKGTSGLRVVDRIGLTREANLTVVEVANRMLLLGVTARGVTMLADLDADPGTALDATLDAAAPGKLDSSGSSGMAREPDDEDQEYAQRAVQAARALAHPVLSNVKDRVSADVEAEPQRLPVPTGVALDQYPDLASALRAAGRTSGSTSAPTTSGRMAATPPAPTRAPEESAPAPTAPRTRAEARAEARARAAAAAQEALQTPVQEPVPAPAQAPFQAPFQLPVQVPTRAPAQVPTEYGPAPGVPTTTGTMPSSSSEIDRIPAQRNQSATGGKKRVVPQPSQQASGSVLSPRTWRQGIEALRDLTVRRG